MTPAQRHEGGRGGPDRTVVQVTFLDDREQPISSSALTPEETSAPGAVEIIMKPFEFRQLVGAVERTAEWLDSHR